MINSITFPIMFNKDNSQTNLNISYDVKSIHEALKGLFETNEGELLGDPNFGSKIKSMLFSIKTKINMYAIKKLIVDTATKHIPQVSINAEDINIYSNPNNNYYRLTIRYKLVYDSKYYMLDTVLKNE